MNINRLNGCLGALAVTAMCVFCAGCTEDDHETGKDGLDSVTAYCNKTMNDCSDDSWTSAEACIQEHKTQAEKSGACESLFWDAMTVDRDCRLKDGSCDMLANSNTDDDCSKLAQEKMDAYKSCITSH